MQIGYLNFEWSTCIYLFDAFATMIFACKKMTKWCCVFFIQKFGREEEKTHVVCLTSKINFKMKWNAFFEKYVFVCGQFVFHNILLTKNERERERERERVDFILCELMG